LLAAQRLELLDAPAHQCGKYGEMGCEGRSTTLVIVNVALGLVAHENV
jgi:hypothetical protein